MNYGYVRVSTKEQNTGRQNDALDSLGVTVDMIFTDHQSGKDFSRPAYQEMVNTISKGDLLIIKSIDRLGRNYDEIQSIDSCRTYTLPADRLRNCTAACGAGSRSGKGGGRQDITGTRVRSHTEPGADT